MTSSFNPEKYNSWYSTQYGSWVGQLEFSLLKQFIQADKNSSLLDVGCGTGYFSRQFSVSGFNTIAIDYAQDMINFASRQDQTVRYLIGDAIALPFKQDEFDYSSAITSLCFIKQPQLALAEMWRISKKGIVLGLLNRHSLLYLKKANKGDYKGARWDSSDNVRQWTSTLSPTPSQVKIKTALFIPGMGVVSKKIEPFISKKLLLGGFMAVYIKKSSNPNL